MAGAAAKDAQVKKLTVVVVNYNSGSYLKNLLFDLSTIDFIDIVVVDNASDDNSEKAAVGSKVKLLVNKENLGYARAANMGASLAKTPLLAFVNPDCRLEGKVFQVLMRCFGQKGVAAASCKVINPDGSEQRASRRYLPDMGRSASTFLGVEKVFRGKGLNIRDDREPGKAHFVEAFSGAFFLIRTDVFKKLGGFDASYFLHCEDLDLFKRIKDARLKLLWVPDVEVVHYKGASSSNTALVESWKHDGMKHYYDKFHREEWPVYIRWLVPALIQSHFILVWFKSMLGFNGIKR